MIFICGGFFTWVGIAYPSPGPSPGLTQKPLMDLLRLLLFCLDSSVICAIFWPIYCNALQNTQNDCHQWLSDSSRVHRIRPDPAGGAYSTLSAP